MENVIFLLKTPSKAFAAHGAQNVLGVLKNSLPSVPLCLFNQRKLAPFPRQFPQDLWATHLFLLSLSALPMLVPSVRRERDRN